MATVAVLVGDLRDPRCGVGSSVGALLDGLHQPVVAIDPVAGSWRDVRAAARAAARTCDSLVIVYPTASTLQRPRMLLASVLGRAAFRRRRVRLYLHEFRWFHRVHRAVITPFLRLATDRIVVSNEREAEAVRAAGWGWPTRGVDVVVAPPVNGSAPTCEQVTAAIQGVSPPVRAARARTVGVFGMLRPDKGPGWLVDRLRELPPGFDRLVIVGSGWDAFALPADLAPRLALERAGHVDDADLPAHLGGWGLAIAPYWDDGAHDGRMSLRTPLAYGVPTLTPAPRPGLLTLDAPHLVLWRPGAAMPTAVTDDAARRAGADAVMAFEAQCRARLDAALFP